MQPIELNSVEMKENLVFVATLVILNPAWATVSLTTGMIWDGNCHSSSLDTSSSSRASPSYSGYLSPAHAGDS